MVLQSFGIWFFLKKYTFKLSDFMLISLLLDLIEKAMIILKKVGMKYDRLETTQKFSLWKKKRDKFKILISIFPTFIAYLELWNLLFSSVLWLIEPQSKREKEKKKKKERNCSCMKSFFFFSFSFRGWTLTLCERN